MRQNKIFFVEYVNNVLIEHNIHIGNGGNIALQNSKNFKELFQVFLVLNMIPTEVLPYKCVHLMNKRPNVQQVFS